MKRQPRHPAHRNKVLFGDNPSGELFWFDADKPPSGGSADMHRVLLRADGGQPKTARWLPRRAMSRQGEPYGSILCSSLRSG